MIGHGIPPELMLLDSRNLQRMPYVICPNPAQTARVQKLPCFHLQSAFHYMIISAEDALRLAFQVAHGAESSGFGPEFHRWEDHEHLAVAGQRIRVVGSPDSEWFRSALK